MRLLAIVLLLTTLAGCLGGAPEADGPVPAGPDDPPSEDRGLPPPPVGGATDDAQAGSFPLRFEGIDCVESELFVYVDEARLEPYMPPFYEPSGSPLASTRITVYSCASAILGNDSFGESVQVMLYDKDLAVGNDNGTTGAFYLLELVTDWEPLHGAMSGLGVNSHLATIDRAAGAAEDRITIQGSDLDYMFESSRDPVRVDTGDSDWPMLAGPGGDLVLRYQVARGQGTAMYEPAVGTASGGVVGGVTGGTFSAINLYSEGSLIISNLR